MAPEELHQRLLSVLYQQLGAEPSACTPEARIIEDLGADSLDTMEIIMALEEEFEIDIPDEEAEKILTVGELEKYLSENADLDYA